jgi:hypothetical protein
MSKNSMSYTFVKKLVKSPAVKPVSVVNVFKIDFLKKDFYDFFKNTTILECGKCPLKPSILSFCVEFNFIKSL